MARHCARRGPAAGSCGSGSPTSSSAAGATWRGRWSTPRRGEGSRRRSWRPTRTSASRTGSRRRSPIASSSAFPIEGRDGPKYRVTGRPIPARNRAPSRAEGRRAFELPPRARVLLVFGGSQGAASLNDLIVEAFGETGPAVLHLSGERDYERLRGRVKRDDYKLLPFTDDFGAALAAADLVVARAGGSVWEVAAAGKPAILVPYPFATADHQAKNALYFEQAGGAITVPETELGRVPDLARSLLGDADRLKEMGEAMKRVARPDAAEEIAEELIALAS